MRRPSIAAIVERPISSPTSSLTPTLYWPGHNGSHCDDLEHFPEVYDAKRRSTKTELVSPQFEAAVEKAVDRLWILDPHFDVTGVTSLLDALEMSQVKQVRIASNIGEELARDLLRKVKAARNKRDMGKQDGEIEWWRFSKDFAELMHDRFAIIDCELWHFGATVGGGYAGLTAVSHGSMSSS
jgi:hypothetical protein